MEMSKLEVEPGIVCRSSMLRSVFGLERWLWEFKHPQVTSNGATIQSYETGCMFSSSRCSPCSDIDESD